MEELSFLGKSVEYPEFYNPALLQKIPRALQREALNISPQKINFEKLPFFGWDILNHYEISYVLNSGKPAVGILEIYAPADSPYLVESKSLKLYFNSLNMHKFKNSSEFLELIQKDLNQAYGMAVKLKFLEPESFKSQKIQDFSGVCLDKLNIAIENSSAYLPESECLKLERDLSKNKKIEEVEETLYSNLLKSNCLITGQPDWASVQIYYQGRQINHESLLKYLISFRQHQEFHEHCIERIFMDILRVCQPEKLIVFGRYTRRGGIDINPFRASSLDLCREFCSDLLLLNIRHARQ